MRAFKTAFLLNKKKKSVLPSVPDQKVFKGVFFLGKPVTSTCHLMNIVAYRPKLHENIELWQNQIESCYCWQHPASGCRSRTVWFFNVIGAHISFREKKFFAVQVQHFCLHPRVGPSVFRKKINQFCIHHAVRNYKGCLCNGSVWGSSAGGKKKKEN